LFAMKCQAMRIGGVEETSDVNDIRALARETGMATVQEALELVAEFYPSNMLEPKVQFGLEEILGGPVGDPGGSTNREATLRQSASASRGPVTWKSPTGPKRVCSISSIRSFPADRDRRKPGYVESPTAVRRRMLFVSEDSVFRPRAVAPIE
jgi:hypothetical protein